jgi:pyrimidine-nucleoside phosphorylase
MYDLIEKKKRGCTLSKEELTWMVSGLDGRIPDYQITAFLMAVYFQGMEDRELADFTLAMAHSGELADLSGISGFKADKHSTGGVGDKTTLVLAPIAAACGVKIAKMSGRGLGFTGGTIDKLECIPGYRTQLEPQEFFRVVNQCGMALIGQSGDLAPADKKLYALRDVTATVDSIPLIAASIMSKKLASGSDGIVLDVKVGSGAFMKTRKDAVCLAEKMIAIGKHAGKRMTAVITNMDEPLGQSVGNILEVKEAVSVLKGGGPKDVRQLSIELAAQMIALSGETGIEESRKKAEKALEDGSAYRCFLETVREQGGKTQVLENTNLFLEAQYQYEFVAGTSGYLTRMDTQKIGTVSMLLGAGRITKDSSIDPSAGIVFEKKTGDYVSPGDTIAVLHSNSCYGFEEAERLLKEAVVIDSKKTEKKPLIFEIIG